MDSSKMSDSDINDFSFSKTADRIEMPSEMPTAKQLNSFSSFAKHACDRCSKRFETKFLLNLHCVTRCPKLPYACNGCELRFSNLSNFRSHLKICKNGPKEKEQSFSKTRMNQSVGTLLTKEEDPTGSNARKNQNFHLKRQPKKKDLSGSITKEKQKEPNEEEPTGSNAKKRQNIQPKQLIGSKAIKPQKIYMKRPSEENPTGSNARKRQSSHPKQMTGSKVIKRQRTYLKEQDKDDSKGSTSRKSSDLHIEVPKVESPTGLNVRKQQKRHMKPPDDNLSGSSDEKPFDGDSADSTDRGNVTKRREMVPSTCKICHLTFSDGGRLERHMRIHTGKKAYQCDKCHLGFYWKSNYERHLKIECKAESLHECKMCLQLFTRKFSLLRHYQTRHAESNADLEISKPDANKDEAHNDDTEVNSKEDTQDQSGENTGVDSDEDEQNDCRETEADSDEDKQHDSKEDTEEDFEQNSDSYELNLYKLRETSSNLKKMEHNDKQLAKNDDNVDQKPDTSKRQRKRKHTTRRYKCDICDLWFMWKCDLNRHRITHSNNKAYPCNQCELGFNWKSNLTRHQRNVHFGKPAYRCDNCGDSFVKSHHLSRHISNYCSKRHHLRSRKLNRLRKDDEGHNSAESSTLNSQTLKKNPHQDDASDNPEMKYCSKSEQEVVIKAEPDSSSKTTPEEIRPDIDQHVNIVYLHVCQKGGYSTESTCENIQTTCSMPPEATVSGVPLDANYKEPADISIKVEDEDIPTPKGKNGPQKEFVCSKCSRVFYRKTCHVQHERSHDRQPIKCHWCGREFIRKSLFDKHVLIHTVEKPFSCEVCPAYFRLQSQLITHLKSHSGQKPFECEFCKNRFSRVSLLERHRMTHTGERPFKCEYCGLAFIQKCSLVLHQKVHVGQKPYRCVKCGVRFAERLGYERHMDRVHDGETAESFFRRKHRKVSTVVDQHIYNTRFAQKVNEDQDEDVDDPISSKKIKCNDATGVEVRSNPNKEYDVEYLESVNVRSRRRVSRNSNRGSAAKTDENSDYCEVIEEKVPSHQKPENKSVSLRREKVGNYATGVFVKQVATHKDLNSNESGSVNAFLKSYKSRSAFKGKEMRKNRAWYHGKGSVRTMGEMSRIREAMGALEHSKNENRATIESKKGKDAKSKIRRCSKEMEISEGLKNFHIGPCKMIVFGVNDSDIKSAHQDAIQPAKYETFVESHSFSGNSTDGNNYETQQGAYIFQDIITVESPTTVISLKCDEDSESHDLNRKRLNSVIVQKGESVQCNELEEAAINSQEANENNLKYKEAVLIDESCEIEDELEKCETNQSDENFMTSEESIADCHQGIRGKIVNKIDEKVAANETGKYVETANIIRVRKCLTNLNDAEQKKEFSENHQKPICQKETESHTRNEQTVLIDHQDTCNRLDIDLKEMRDCQKSDTSEGLSQTLPCNCSGQNQHEEVILCDQVVESGEKICVCKDDSDSTTIFIHGAETMHEEVQAFDDNRITNIIRETSESVISLKKSILPVLEKDFKRGEEINFKSFENTVDFEQIEESMVDIHRGQTEQNHQNEDCQMDIEVYKKELDNGRHMKDTRVGNKENDNDLGLRKNDPFPDGSMKIENTLFEDEVVINNYQCVERTGILIGLNMQEDPSTGDVKSFETIDEIPVEETKDNLERIKVDRLTNCFEEASGDQKEYTNVTLNDKSNCIQENVIGTSSDTLYDIYNEEINSNQYIDDGISNTSLENYNNKNNGVNQIHSRISNDSLKRIGSSKTGLIIELRADQELIPVPIQYDVSGDHIPDKCAVPYLNNCEETDSCLETDIKQIIMNNDLNLHGAICNPNTQAESPVMNKPDRCEENDIYQQSCIFPAVPCDNQSIQFRSINSSSSVHKENNFSQNREGKLVCNTEPISRKTTDINPENHSQETYFDRESTQINQVEVPTNHELTGDDTDTVYAETSFEQNKKINVCFLNVSSEQSDQFPYNVYRDEQTPHIEMQIAHVTDVGEMNTPYLGIGLERNQVPILDVHSEKNIQPSYDGNIDKELPVHYETSAKPVQYTEVLFGHSPGYQHFDMDSIKNVAPHTLNNEDFESALHSSDQTLQFHGQITPDPANNEVQSNYQVQRSTYEADIDEETIRYAVQTVQAIIQSEVPMCRETVQSIQAPVQYHGQEIIRYETQSFQVPFRYGTSVQRGYDVHTHPVEFQSIQASSKHDENTQREFVQYDVSNMEFPFRYSYGDSENVHQPVQLRSGPDHGKIVHHKEACSNNYPTAFIKQDSIVYKGHDAIGFEEVFSANKPRSDLIPVNRNLEFVPYEKASSNLNSMPNEVHSLVPYESVEVSETVYTNLELASYCNPSTVTYVPYKELFIDKGVIQKGQRSIDQNVLYSKGYSYANASEKFYTIPVRAQAMHSAEAQQSQLSINYEKLYSYPDHQENNLTFLQDCAPETAANEAESFTYQDLISSGQPKEKELRRSSVSGQYSRVQKKIRKNRIRTEMLGVPDPKKTRVRNKIMDYVELNRQKSSSIDFVLHKSVNFEHCNNQRSSCDQDKNAFFDQASKKTIAFDQDINNSNNTSLMVSHDSPPDDMSQKSSYEKETEKSFECDKCTRIFNRKNDLIRHRFTEHEKIRPSSSLSK